MMMMTTTMVAVWCGNTKMIYAHNTLSTTLCTKQCYNLFCSCVSANLCCSCGKSLTKRQRKTAKKKAHTVSLSYYSTQLSKQIQIILPKSDEFLPSYTTLVDVVCIKLDLLFPCNFHLMHLLIHILFYITYIYCYYYYYYSLLWDGMEIKTYLIR